MLSFVQRAGHAARASDRTGLAVLLVEKSVYGLDLMQEPKSDSPGSKSRGKSLWSASSYSKVKVKDYAVIHGVKRGNFEGKDVDTEEQVGYHRHLLEHAGKQASFRLGGKNL
jgi:hypothetical protein